MSCMHWLAGCLRLHVQLHISYTINLTLQPLKLSTSYQKAHIYVAIPYMYALAKQHVAIYTCHAVNNDLLLHCMPARYQLYNRYFLKAWSIYNITFCFFQQIITSYNMVIKHAMKRIDLQGAEICTIHALRPSMHCCYFAWLTQLSDLGGIMCGQKGLSLAAMFGPPMHIWSRGLTFGGPLQWHDSDWWGQPGLVPHMQDQLVSNTVQLYLYSHAYTQFSAPIASYIRWPEPEPDLKTRATEVP